MTVLSAKKTAYGGIFACLALILSYVESFLPMSYLTGIPGFKLGFANICVVIAVYSLGIGYGAFIMLTKVALSALLFGSVTSFAFSLGGSLLAFAFLVFAKCILKDKLSFIGISVGSAALHNAGQVCVACAVFGDASLILYLVWLLPVSVFTGIITGSVIGLVSKYMEKIL